MERLCVFTATYNRAYCITDLYASLTNQTNGDFYWLVVDDGSTDETSELISELQARGKIRIEYLRQENGGKQRAHNTGVDACTSPLFFCVDSDDTLTPNAIELILNRWDAVGDDERIAGIVGLDGATSTKPIGNSMPRDNYTTTLWDLQYNEHHIGDVALIYRTSILKDYPFHVHPDEKFIAETYVYNQIDQSYLLSVLDEILIVCQYRPDGYTQNARKITRENPHGYMRLKLMQIQYADSYLLKFKSTVLYLVGCIFAGQGIRSGIKDAPSRVLATLAAPLALILAQTEFRK
ncbi:glycosyltransferase family 2 protein [Adlercreutzia muris]|uniref:glycosyltransferase family 2 protein n=1 Tax=Adlercreutzia muris TaxID=1796610 RepID=UPI001F563840|nr:glycosyltransferase family 2 protein [Adlercreutzia muris]